MPKIPILEKKNLGPIPQWVVNLDRWSYEQAHDHSYNRDQSFYNLDEGGSADKAHPVLVRQVARNDKQGRSAIDGVVQVSATTRVNIVCRNHLIRNHKTTRDIIKTL